MYFVVDICNMRCFTRMD